MCVCVCVCVCSHAHTHSHTLTCTGIKPKGIAARFVTLVTFAQIKIDASTHARIYTARRYTFGNRDFKIPRFQARSKSRDLEEGGGAGP